MTNPLYIIGIALVGVLVVGGGIASMISDSPDATASFQPDKPTLSGEYVDWTISATNNMDERADIEMRLTKEEGEKDTIYFTDGGQQTDRISLGSIAPGQSESETFRVHRNQSNDATVQVTAEVIWTENNSVLTSTQGTVQLSDIDNQ
jgi:hypothetical protein